MSARSSWTGLAIALCLRATASAEEGVGSPVEAPDLPPPALVMRAIAAQPQVQAARADADAERAQRARLVAGPYEPALRMGGQSRRIDDPGARFGEWTVGLERTLRLPGKAALDAAIGEQGVRQAEAAWHESQHEAARAVLQDWFAWLRESVQATEWQAQVALLAEQQQAVARRQRAGDASRLESEQAGAAFDQADAQRALAVSRREAAARGFVVRHGIELPSEPQVVEPAPIVDGPDAWRDRVLGESHELAIAREASARALLLARRADSERRPDPTVGVHVSSERGGAERVMGLNLLVPFGGDARTAAADAAASLARAAGRREAAVRRRLEAEVATLHARAVGQRDGWQRLARAAQRIEQGAALAARAYALGEGTVADVLLARRLSGEARLAAALARTDAAEGRYRLLLDGHALWEFDAP